MTEPFPVDVRPDALDWLTAVGTIGATILAVVAIGIQIADRHRREEEQRRAQAVLISAWVHPEPRGQTAGGKPYLVEYSVRVRNGSDEVVYDVWVRPPGMERRQVGDLGVIGPGTTVAFRLNEISRTGVVPFELEFVDAAGQSWVRHPNGRLTRQPASSSPPASTTNRQPPKYRLH